MTAEQNEWLDIVELATAATNHYNLSTERKRKLAQQWAELLENETPEQVKKAVKQIARTQDWMPTTNQILQTIHQHEHPPANVAWDQLSRRIEETNTGINYTETLDPLIIQARQNTNIRNTTHKDRETFENEYNKLLTKERTNGNSTP